MLQQCNVMNFLPTVVCKFHQSKYTKYTL